MILYEWIKKYSFIQVFKYNILERESYMAKKVSEKERDKIKKILINKSREMFIENGFKGTSISKITKSVDIATGSFYKYFDSKEEIFLRIYINEDNKLKNRIVENMNMDHDPTEMIKQMFFQYLKGVEANPILNQYYKMKSFKDLDKKTDFDRKKAYKKGEYDLFIPLIEKWQREKVIKDMDPRLIFAFVDSIFFTYAHKADIGEEFFPELLDYLISFIVEGLKE